MAVSPDDTVPNAVKTPSFSRKGRFEPIAIHKTNHLTAQQVAVLHGVSQLRIGTTNQLADYLGLSLQGVRRSARVCFDGGFVNLIIVPRIALTSPGETGFDMVFGSAPNIYTCSRKGGRFLMSSGLIDTFDVPRKYGPQNWSYIAHELQIVDFRIWLEQCARIHDGHSLTVWLQDGNAHVNLNRTKQPRVVRPDAWFVYQLKAGCLVGFLEIDRASERLSGRRWSDKVQAYAELLKPERLHKAVGYQRARVLIVTPSKKRTEELAEFIKQSAPAAIIGQFWLTEVDTLRSDLTKSSWRRATSDDVTSLFTKEQL